MKTLEVLESFFKSKVDSRGRVYLPKEAREKLSIKPGDRIYLKIQNGYIIVLTLKTGLKYVCEMDGVQLFRKRK